MSVFSYLKLPIPDGEEETMRQDMDALTVTAREAPGYIWAEVLRPISGEASYVIASEWESLDNLRAWEHSPQHQPVVDSYKGIKERKRYMPLA
ncbi:MAG: antibiotic biosynthesis monooxygenase [Dehalococcoidia bacterium]|nr:antibiotic biosynthesis monooxygenase [Dehalococcoidia bacterium]